MADVVSTTRLVSRSVRAWRIVGDVRVGEGRRVALFGLQIFLLLTAYYLLKTVREPLILLWGIWGLHGQELKVYATSAQAVLLLGVLPLYARLVGRVPRLALIRYTLVGFVACLAVFVVLGRSGVPIAGPFYMWLGIVSLLGVAQFWSLAVDLYKTFLNPGVSQQRLLTVSRIASVAAGVTGDLVAPTTFTAQHMSPQRRAAALLDGRHDLELGQAQVTVLRCAPGWPVTAKDVGDLQRGAPHSGRTTTAAASPTG